MSKSDYKNFIIDPVDISFGKNVILDKAKLTITFGEKYGLVGKNGIGKTSLLNAIANRELKIPEKLDMIYVKQEEPESDTNVVDAVMAADPSYDNYQRLYQLEALIDDPEVDDDVLDEYNELARLIGSDHINAKNRALKILAGLGFDQADKKVIEFSGGWRMRISLAKALYLTPTLLILDEPSNHLDLDAVIWLTSYLKIYPKTLLLVSHDRYIIDEVCTTIINIANYKLDYYRGNYQQFSSQLEVEKEKQKKDWDVYQKKLVALKKSSKNKDQLEAFIKKSNMTKPEKDYRVQISFMQPTIVKGSYLDLTRVAVGYDNDSEPIVQNINLTINSGTRMAIMGKNGIGKSTILKLFVGDLEPMTGELIRSHYIRIGYYNQHFESSMPLDIDPVQYLMNLNSSLNLTEAHKYLGMFGLDKLHHSTVIGSLSGGQKARVKFASFGVTKPHLLILDEPSNHLDITTMDSLIKALESFTGAIIIVSHNFDLITKLQCELWVVANRTIKKYLSSYQNYLCRIYDSI